MNLALSTVGNIIRKYKKYGNYKKRLEGVKQNRGYPTKY